MTTEPVMQKRSEEAKWTPFHIVSIIVGFILFWPLGLFLLIWVGMGREISELPGIIHTSCLKMAAWIRLQSHSGNRVFDEFQQTQLDRIDEIKAEIRERRNAFQKFKEERDRKAEEKEFEEFMRKKPENGPETESS